MVRMHCFIYLTPKIFLAPIFFVIQLIAKTMILCVESHELEMQTPLDFFLIFKKVEGLIS